LKFGIYLLFGAWNLEFIYYLVLGICDFKHKTPRQSHLSLTWPRGPGFSGQNKRGNLGDALQLLSFFPLIPHLINLLNLQLS
jgi:hypothetical protein